MKYGNVEVYLPVTFEMVTKRIVEWRHFLIFLLIVIIAPTFKMYFISILCFDFLMDMNETYFSRNLEF